MVEKGWEQHHIDHTLHILYKAQKNKHPYLKLLDEALVWGILLIVLFANIVLSIALIPVVIAMPSTVSLLVTFFFGLCFGALVDLVARDIDALTHHHFIAVGIFLPIVSVISILITSKTAQIIAQVIKPIDSFNPLLLSLVYIVSFTSPHFTYRMLEHYEIDLGNVI